VCLKLLKELNHQGHGLHARPAVVRAAVTAGEVWFPCVRAAPKSGDVLFARNP
jgi:hypothetical protein